MELSCFRTMFYSDKLLSFYKGTKNTGYKLGNYCTLVIAQSCRILALATAAVVVVGASALQFII